MDTRSYELPPELPRPEQPDNIEATEEGLDSKKAEHQEAASAAEAVGAANKAIGQALLTGTPPLDDGSNPTLPAADVTTAVQSNNTPIIADDVDVIEKEWVQKAKQIVTKTKEDPHQQSVELNTFKRDYIKKRYGKEIKLPEELKGA